MFGLFGYFNPRLAFLWNQNLCSLFTAWPLIWCFVSLRCFRQEFFTVTWTTLTMVTSDGRKKRHNVLAAAGRRGIVKLIHVAADYCYGEIKAHKKPIATACFSPITETHLFSKSPSLGHSGGPWLVSQKLPLPILWVRPTWLAASLNLEFGICNYQNYGCSGSVC